jgi:hypothetical protein
VSLRYCRPAAEPAVVARHPVRAGDRDHRGRDHRGRDHPGRDRLAGLLDAVDEEAEPVLARIAGDVALELTLGLPPWQPLTRRRDLVNYLLPVVARLGQRRVPAVFARKRHADTSRLTVAPAGYLVDDRSPALQVRPVGSPHSPGWMEQVRDACAAAVGGTPPHPGAAALDLAFVVSSRHNWTTLWKPAIDAVAGPLLGVPDPDNPWSPNDDHITRLGLHRTIDASVGCDVVIAAWWSLDHDEGDPPAGDPGP